MHHCRIMATTADGKNGRRWWWWKRKENILVKRLHPVIMHMMFTISISPYVASKCIQWMPSTHTHTYPHRSELIEQSSASEVQIIFSSVNFRRATLSTRRPQHQWCDAATCFGWGSLLKAVQMWQTWTVYMNQREKTARVVCVCVLAANKKNCRSRSLGLDVPSPMKRCTRSIDNNLSFSRSPHRVPRLCVWIFYE